LTIQFIVSNIGNMVELYTRLHFLSFLINSPCQRVLKDSISFVYSNTVSPVGCALCKISDSFTQFFYLKNNYSIRME